MSSVEEGLGGVWSCLYCEGTWLFANQLKAMTAACGAFVTAEDPSKSSNFTAQSVGSFCCPICDQAELVPVRFGSVFAEHCNQCGGAFFKKGVVGEHAPAIFSASDEAPVAATLIGIFGAVAVGSDLPLAAALARKPRA